VDELAEAINTVRATSWTPLAEALYSALGYYTQNINLCLNCRYKNNDGSCADIPINYCEDFPITPDPVQYWCQDNHILLITEGESTADINPAVKYLAEAAVEADEKKELQTPRVCSEDLYGSTYLTAMTWWGQNAHHYYKVPKFIDPDGNETKKQNIFTHVVTTGALANIGTGECNPQVLMHNAAYHGGTDTYYPGENPTQLEANLRAALDDIMSRSSAGSAASVISSSRSGSGAVYQAVFWPEYKGENGTKVTWVGDVHALFVSSDGLMHEDTNQDGKLDPQVEGGKDRQVVLYFSDAVNKTRGCYDIKGFYDPEQFKANGNKFICPDDPINSCNPDPECPKNPKEPCKPSEEPSEKHSCVELQDIAYIWSVKNHLSERSKSTETDIVQDRKIFTWNDLNNDGIVDDDEWFELSTLREENLSPEHLKDGSTLSKLNKKTEGNNRGPVGTDFFPPSAWNDLLGYAAEPTGLTEEERADWRRLREQKAMNVFVEWMQGQDDESGRLRSRKVTVEVPLEVSGVPAYDTINWLLGDVIHSTPIVVGRPAEAYHYIYRDFTYAKFAARWANRRHMVYFGGNDGMLHAVNGGFYLENDTQFCCTHDGSGKCDEKDEPKNGVCPDPYHDLGKEMWAYIPYNLQPHLKCLTDRHYAHKYYVDQKPRIFDVQIFEEDADYVGGWGTILVGSMRFGGAPIEAKELNGHPDDERVFTSAFFILDITNPEKDPRLLAEMTFTSEKDTDGNELYVNLNYTTSSPSMVIMRDGENNDPKSAWYLVMGNGPTDQDATNEPNKQGTLAILPLNWLDGEITVWDKGVSKTSNKTKRAFRIPNEEPSTVSKQGGRFLVPLAKENSASFISDIISVDYNIDMTATDDLGVRYRTDAVYFSTVDGTGFKKYPEGYLTNFGDQFHWDGGGRLFRLVTKVLDSNSPIGQELASQPSDWANQWLDSEESKKYNKGPIRLLADLQMPSISAPAIGYDGRNYWVYTGTGRFFSENDKTDDGWNISLSPTKNTKTSFFGLKEPLLDGSHINPPNWKKTLHPDLNYSRYPVMTWGRIDWDINNQDNSNLNHNGVPGQRGLMQSDKIYVAYAPESVFAGGASYLICSTGNDKDTECFPDPVWEHVIDELHNPQNLSEMIEVPVFKKLQDYITGTGFELRVDGKYYATGLDGWYRDFHDARERNLGAAALLGGLLTYTSYQPFNDPCSPEGESYLYGVHFQTGTAWTDSVFGTFEHNRYGGTQIFVKDRLSLGRGLSTTPSMHVGSGDDAAKAFIQTSTGEIIEVSQENLPIPATRSGRQSWSDRPHQ
jgi:type IV pilus assembly protein PilY1